MKKKVFARKCIRTFLLFPVIVSILLNLSFLTAQETSPSESGLTYYHNLKNEDFLRTMVPKEGFLLEFVKNVNDEINRRRSEGVTLSDLGIREVLPPEELFVGEYVRELQRVVDLQEEIIQLERSAKQQVNFRVLEALSRLKKRVREIIEDDKFYHKATISDLNLEKTQDKNDDHFDENSDSDDAVSDKESEDPMELDDLFEQWKYNRVLEYKVKLTEYEFLRTRLLRTATPFQETRMFQRDLKTALLNYSAGNFQLSRLQLQDVLKTYSNVRVLDDVLFFCSESSYGCNYLDEALAGYHRLVSEYPESQFSAKALVKIIYIYYIYGEFHKLQEVYEQLVPLKEHLDTEFYGAVSYLVAYAHFKAGDYENALNFMGDLVPGTTYYFPSLYLSATCYSNIGQDELALSIYHRLVEEKNRGGKDPVLTQIKNNAFLKLGLMYYEKGDHDQATYFFNRVTEDFKYYDLSVMGKAWSAYSSGKPGEALRNVEWLLKHSLISRYVYEARVLAARSKELLGYSEEAIDDLKQVFRTGKRVDQIGEKSPNRIAMLQKVQEVERYQHELQKERDREMLAMIEEIRQFLTESTSELRPSEPDQGKSDYDFVSSMQTLTENIEILDRYEELAREIGNDILLEEIRSLRSDLIETLDDHKNRVTEAAPDPEEDPIIRRMGMTDYFKYVFRSLLMQTLREKEQTKKDIKEAEALYLEARGQDNFDLGIRMEIAKEEFQDYYGKLNQQEVWLRENYPQDYRVELDQWATFSGYGISNINFSRIKDYERQIQQASQTIDDLDFVFKEKRRNLENRIQGLLSDVAKIEEQMLQEASKKELKEKDRFFKVEYFNRQRQEPVAGKLREKPDLKKKKVKE